MMRSRLFIIMVMLLADISVFADSFTIADLSSHDYAIYINDSQGTAGGQVTLSINMKDANAVTLCQTDIALPEGITVATDDEGKPLVKLSTARTKTANHTLESNILADGSLRVFICSSGLKNFSGRDGEVATITLNISKDLEPGDYNITLKNNLIAQKDQTEYKPDTFLAKLTVTSSSYTLGDVDNSGTISIADLASLISYLNGTTPSVFYKSAADINGDGNIDKDDVLALSQLILNQ